eukprot:m.34384 g.34384  ORF g.34384 m.34384 type:complete len:593 (+) comp6527_c0_seq2:70-1848(+)
MLRRVVVAGVGCGSRRGLFTSLASSSIHFELLLPSSKVFSTMTEPKESAPPEGFVKIKEGQAEILFPDNDEVFYNPVQVFNRDMSTCVISVFGKKYLQERSQRARRKLQLRWKEDGIEEEEVDNNSIEKYAEKYPQIARMRGDQDSGYTKQEHGINILEALAASGLRSIRYYKEIPTVSHIICNDFSEEAVESIKRNVEFNNLDQTTQVKPNHGDATLVMYHHRAYDERFDVIDLDPYGTAAPFLDGALQSVRNGGLLCITCTDMAVLCGAHGDTCFAKYGAMPIKAQHCHEMGVRILLGLTSMIASRYGRYIEPLLSCSIDFYTRVFVRVNDGAAKAKLSATKMTHYYQCTYCQNHLTPPMGRQREGKKGGKKFVPGQAPPISQLCNNCNRIYQMGGPLWGGPLHDNDFIDECIAYTKERGDFATEKRMMGMLATCREELDIPLFYTINGLCGNVHCSSIPHEQFRSALGNAGYMVSPTHCTPQGIKTDAPEHVIWDIIRAWVKDNPVSSRVLEGDSPAATILSKEITTNVDFTFNVDVQPKSSLTSLTRYQMNPTKNWGPKSRAKGGKRKPGEDVEESNDNQQQQAKKEK